jgi:sulfide:quinone oxidoreductase
MQAVSHLTPRFAVTAALAAEDFAEAARLGFKAIVSNRPDGEEPGQLTARQEAALAWRAGLKFRHVPTSKHDVFTDDAVAAMAEALADLDGPVLAHCKSGVRSAIVWAAASSSSQPVDCILDALRNAGMDMDFIRDDLDAQADRKHWLSADTVGTALDCECDVVTLQPGESAAA